AVPGRPVRADLRLRRARTRQRRAPRARGDPPREPPWRHAPRDGAALLERERLYRSDASPLLLVAELRPVFCRRRARLLQPRALPPEVDAHQLLREPRQPHRLPSRQPLARALRAAVGVDVPGVVPLLRARGGQVDMRVLHVVPALFGPDGLVGGAERYAFELARHMASAVPTKLVGFGETAREEWRGPLRVRTLPAWHVRGQRSNP